MTKLDRDQLEKISGGAEAVKIAPLAPSIEGVKSDQTIHGVHDEAKDDSPAIINPVVRPGAADD